MGIAEMTKKGKKKKSQIERAQSDEYDLKHFIAEIEKLEKRQQALIKTIVGKIYEALKESNVMAFASTPGWENIAEEVLKAAYHISNLTWKYEK